MNNQGGSRTWYFPDGYLPPRKTCGELESHEALMLLNVGEEEAHVVLDFYFSDQDPKKNIPVTVPPERIMTLRLDHPLDIGGITIPPMTQYSLRVRSDRPIVAQFGRLDLTLGNLAYYCAPGIWETHS